MFSFSCICLWTFSQCLFQSQQLLWFSSLNNRWLYFLQPATIHAFDCGRLVSWRANQAFSTLRDGSQVARKFDWTEPWFDQTSFLHPFSFARRISLSSTKFFADPFQTCWWCLVSEEVADSTDSTPILSWHSFWSRFVAANAQNYTNLWRVSFALYYNWVCSLLATGCLW